jgi:AcrR family transcriptional regulator
MANVKTSRRYDSAGRQRQALRTRATVLDVAQRRFIEDGYAASTVAAVAGDAGVSVETVYKTFGGKPGLVRAIHERGLAGSGPVPAPHRSDAMQDRERNPRAIIRNWGRLTTEVAPRVAPILLLIRSAAATDPEMAELLTESDAQRLRRMRHNARSLADRGHLRPGVTLGAATDVLWTYSSPDLYDLLVVRRHWSVQRYGRFVADAMIAALLP